MTIQQRKHSSKYQSDASKEHAKKTNSRMNKTTIRTMGQETRPHNWQYKLTNRTSAAAVQVGHRDVVKREARSV
ncbi:hypothetical protein J1614_004118 [Plenodomus biglobosus]|nr:hypothetical protein J1614_004118 [Plenodomus biglobosus]